MMVRERREGGGRGVRERGGGGLYCYLRGEGVCDDGGQLFLEHGDDLALAPRRQRQPALAERAQRHRHLGRAWGHIGIR